MRKYIVLIVLILFISAMFLASATSVQRPAQSNHGISNESAISYGEYSSSLSAKPAISGCLPSTGSGLNGVVHTINVGSSPYAAAYDANNSDIYVSNTGSNNVSVISGSTNQVIDSVAIGTSPEGIAFDPSNGNMYVANTDSSSVSVISSSNNTVIKTVHVGSFPSKITYASSNGNMYVVNMNSNNVSVIASSNNSVLTSINVGTTPVGITYDPSNENMYVANQGSNNISVISTATNKVTNTMNLSASPNDVAYDANNSYLYVPVYSEVYVYSTNGSYVTGVFVGTNPQSAIYNHYNGNVYVLNSGSNSVSIISSSSDTVIKTVNVGTSPQGMGYDSENANIYVTNQASKNVSVINTGNQVKFTESGLSSGSTWYVNLSNGQVFSSTTTTLSFIEPNGNFTYTLATGNKVFSPSVPSGSFTLNGTSIAESVTFNKVTYKATFSESGLPSGTAWYVNLSNGVNSGAISGTSYSVSLSNGTYSYNVSTADSTFSPAPAGGSFTVKGPAALELIIFSRVTYNVTFTESGLSNGVMWYVNLSSNQNFSSTGSAITLQLSNGTYSYTIATDNSTFEPQSSSGSFTVNGASVSESITFKKNEYTVTFKESGLPSGTMWYVNSSTLKSSSNTNTISMQKPNGTYSYTLATENKTFETTPASGTFKVHGSSESIAVKFSEIKYTVTFKESGLPTGSIWYLNITGQSKSGQISGSTYSASLPNGSYSYTTGTSSVGYNESAGMFKVNGGSSPVSVTFNKESYNVTFRESGLKSGTKWYVNTSGNSQFSTNGTLQYLKQDGSYDFTVTNLTNYYTLNHTVSVKVFGSDVIVNIKFQPWNYLTVHVKPSNATVTVNGKDVSLSSGQFNITEPNGTYDLKATSSGYQAYYDNLSLSNGVDKNITIDLNKTAGTSGAGISSAELYGIVGGISALIVISAVFAVVRRRH